MKSKTISIILMSIVWMGMGASNCCAQLSRAQAEDAFARANEFYSAGNYEHAVEAYEGIINQGRESAALYFNLGNSYYKKGDSGQALLNYARGRRLSPRDSDLIFNQQYVSQRAGLLSMDQALSVWEKLVTRHVEFYTRGEMVFIITVVGAGLGILWILSLVWHWSRQVKVFFTIGLVVILGIFVSGLMIKIDRERSRAVMLKKAKVFFEPREQATIYFELTEGAQVKVEKEQGPWVKIRRFDGKLGWVRSDLLEEI